MDTWPKPHVSRIHGYLQGISAGLGGRGGGRLDRKVMTLGCSKQGFRGCCTHIQKYTHALEPGIKGLGWTSGEADGGGHDRCLQGHLRTSPPPHRLTPVTHRVRYNAHAASWVNPSTLPHALRINKHTFTPIKQTVIFFHEGDIQWLFFSFGTLVAERAHRTAS